MPYLDHAATAPMRPAAREAWLDASQHVGNAASLHTWGRRAEARLARARQQVAALLGWPASSVVFTSGGTEANNLALRGVAGRSERRHLIVSAIEHASVLRPAAALEQAGWRLTRVPVDGDGVVRLSALEAALDDDTALVSVMAVNNEVGSVQPLADISALARAAGARLHVDAVQAAGHLALEGLEADLVSLSAHKLGGPQGTGALLVRAGTPLAPWLLGGGHERGLRAGTLNVPGAAAFGAACERALADRAAESARLAALRDRLRTLILAGVSEARAVGRAEALAPHILMLTIPGLDGESLVQQLDLAGLGASSGAACSALGTEPSHVLVECGLEMARVNGSLRLSLGWATTAAEIDEAARLVIEVATTMRTMRPMAL